MNKKNLILFNIWRDYLNLTYLTLFYLLNVKVKGNQNINCNFENLVLKLVKCTRSILHSQIIVSIVASGIH